MASSAQVYSDFQKEIREREMEILLHLGWHGDISGIECEDLLRGLIPGSYLLREGEREFQYYLSFVLGDPFSFKHQPFLIVKDHSQIIWGYRNGAHRWISTLDSLIPMVMHCALDQCYPLQKKTDGN
ncbi:MAG: SH2 domain-containing protein [Rhabdochlamydiaceae bacterium]